MKKARGRPVIAVESHIEKLEQAILIGATYELAALYAGISKRTFARWRAEMEDADEGTPLAKLRDRLQEAEGRAAFTWLTQIERVANEGNWQAAAWKLERRWPETYGRTMQKIAFTDPSGEQPVIPQLQIVLSTEPQPRPLLPAGE